MSTIKERLPALPPGTLHYVGEEKKHKIRMRGIRYNKDSFEEFECKKPHKIPPATDPTANTWLDVNGVHNAKLISQFGEAFQLHPLLLEDIMDTEQRAKVEEHENCIFIIFKMLYLRKETDDISYEYISMVIGDHFILTFQQQPGDIWNPVRERIQKGKPRMRGLGADYLLYALIDAIVDNYLLILDNLEDQIEAIEEKTLIKARSSTVHKIHIINRELIFLGKIFNNAKDVIARLGRRDSELIDPKTRIYFMDVYDHIMQAVDNLNTAREMAANLQNVYLHRMSERTNEAMRVLTAFASIFLPLTFIAGIYGMNFEHMPELDNELAYPIVLCIMGVTALGTFLYFKRKKWL